MPSTSPAHETKVSDTKTSPHPQDECAQDDPCETERPACAGGRKCPFYCIVTPPDPSAIPAIGPPPPTEIFYPNKVRAYSRRMLKFKQAYPHLGPVFFRPGERQYRYPAGVSALRAMRAKQERELAREQRRLEKEKPRVGCKLHRSEYKDVDREEDDMTDMPKREDVEDDEVWELLKGFWGLDVKGKEEATTKPDAGDT
ncbi:hypothetical protein N0V83_008636 [Neocucurbitaria cava]|uniref:Uncharacterized protein n=1 Tax=Neocucurbitaria cava TaxID=798079 RepID=A0A9W8Y3C6_9PLEO|nr:hypothetical protein N0V83_008636 [Neocucurbitaria cava]